MYKLEYRICLFFANIKLEIYCRFTGVKERKRRKVRGKKK